MGRNGLKITLLLAFLIILPVLSVIYLREGMVYRKERLGELKDYGKLPGFSFLTINQKNVTNDSIRGGISVIYPFSMQNSSLNELAKQLNRLQTAYSDRPDIHILACTTDTDAAAIQSYIETNAINTKFWYIISDTSAQMKNFIAHFRKDTLPLSLEEGTVALVDTSLMIRKYYKGTAPDQIKRLGEHIAMKMPPDLVKKFIYRKPEDR